MLKLGLLANRSLEKLNLCQVKMTDEGQHTLVDNFVFVNVMFEYLWWRQ